MMRKLIFCLFLASVITSKHTVEKLVEKVSFSTFSLDLARNFHRFEKFEFLHKKFDFAKNSLNFLFKKITSMTTQEITNFE